MCTDTRFSSATVSLVSNLPIQILVDIFARLPSKPHRNVRRHLPLVVVSHVCRYWRRIALGTPGLWTRIPLTHGPEWAAEALKRSKPFPINLNLQLQSFEQPSYSKAARAVIFQHPNLKTFRLSDESSDLSNELAFEARSAALQALASRAQPFLEAFEVYLEDDEDLEDWKLLLKNMASSHLRKLSACNCPFLPKCPLLRLPSLTHLDITHSCGAWLTVDDLLDDLSELKSLEWLSLSTDYDSHIINQSVPSPRGERSIHLPHLAFLRLSDVFPVIDAVVWSTSFPSTAQIELYARNDEESVIPFDTSRLGGALLNHFAEAAAAGDAFQSANVDIYRSDKPFVFVSLVVSRPRAASAINAPSLPSRMVVEIECATQVSNPVISLFTHIAQLPVFRDVQSVEVVTRFEQEAWSHPQEMETLWQPLFATLTRLSPEFHIHGPGAHALVSAMNNPALGSQFASLRTLYITSVDFATGLQTAQSFFSALLVGLEKKAQDGHSLPHLVIQDCHVSVEMVGILTRYLGGESAKHGTAVSCRTNPICSVPDGITKRTAVTPDPTSYSPLQLAIHPPKPHSSASVQVAGQNLHRYQEVNAVPPMASTSSHHMPLEGHSTVEHGSVESGSLESEQEEDPEQYTFQGSLIEGLVEQEQEQPTIQEPMNEDNDEAPAPCPVCGKTYGRSEDLVRHIETKGGRAHGTYREETGMMHRSREVGMPRRLVEGCPMQSMRKSGAKRHCVDQHGDPDLFVRLEAGVEVSLGSAVSQPRFAARKGVGVGG
ncbi:hypothetical protein OF83DRAFT_1175263 [Amylostereum chailletii]|nr:hypothetical protein OF83DRAFT_1175263 [Amylostereum chailletii]